MTLDEIAEIAGYSGRSSIQRYFKDISSATVRPEIASKFAKALLGRGDPPITVVDMAKLIGLDVNLADAAAIKHASMLLNIGGATETHGLAFLNAEPVGGIAVIGAAHASFWMPSAPSIESPEGWLKVPEWVSPPPGHYALRIVGESINRTAQEGHYAICKEYGDQQHEAPDGKFVHVERQRRGEVEWTIKRVRWTADGMGLWPDSTDKRWQQPIPLGDGDDIVLIRAIVIGWYKPA